jgi:gas vesicle protein
VNHVDETIALLAWARIEEMKLTQQLADIGRLLRAGEWINRETEVLGLPERCKQLTDGNSQLRKQLTEETHQLRQQCVEETNLLRQQCAEETNQLRQQCAEETSQLRQQCAEETNQLREQVAEQAKELQSIKDLLATKEKRGWFAK